MCLASEKGSGFFSPWLLGWRGLWQSCVCTVLSLGVGTHAGCILRSLLLFPPLRLHLHQHIFPRDEGMALHAVPDARKGITSPGPWGKDVEESWSRKSITSKSLA